MAKARFQLWQFGVALVFGSILAGCDSEDDATIEPTLSSLWEAELQNCAFACHEPTGTQALGPDLSTQDQFHANLVGKTVNADYPDWRATRGGDCNDIPFIQPGEPSQSTALASLVEERHFALLDQQGCTTGFNLHAVENITFAEESPFIQAYVTWIEQGAPNN